MDIKIIPDSIDAYDCDCDNTTHITISVMVFVDKTDIKNIKERNEPEIDKMVELLGEEVINGVFEVVLGE